VFHLGYVPLLHSFNGLFSRTTLDNTWFLGLTQVLNLNGISIGAAVFAGLTSVTDRPTDRQTTLLGQ